jgi:predicted secreted protein
MRGGYGLLLIALSAFAAVQAHEPQTVYDRISLSVDAQIEVENDLLVAVLYTEHQGQRQTEVAERVNDAMGWALGKAKTAGDLKVQTLQYTTSPVYRNKVISGWRARQSLRLESRDTSALSEMIGALQERLSVQSIRYSISKTALSGAEDGLISQALTHFKQRARQVTQEMGRDGYRVVQINISTSGQRPPPVAYNARLQMAEAQAAPPALEAGVQTVTVNVSGTIELDPQR